MPNSGKSKWIWEKVALLFETFMEAKKCDG